ncbi:MAG: response regulator [Candidatus Saccharibacteria bacterium]|nr:response regulator [Candidatus Saccharibacteria bacterium]
MAKILLVEDDQSLREIYSIRLTAEGYEIVTAGDGEEALALAVRERPDLILSDVMMPKISGFDMLDILRSTPETKDIKVVMMTALSSDDQRQRGENLGADRYLVKSQVGIEDVVNVVHEVMEGQTESPQAQPITNQPQVQPAAESQSVANLQPTMTPQTVAMPQTAATTLEPVVTSQPTVAMQPAANSQPTNTVSQPATTPNQSTNDSFTINTAADQSGMNLQDKLDQLLGGMGQV